MGCNCCNSGEQLDRLFLFLGIYVCLECKGKGRITEVRCSCCDVETITCPECDGNEFIIEDDSILKPLLDTDSSNDRDDLLGVGLCD